MLHCWQTVLGVPDLFKHFARLHDGGRTPDIFELRAYATTLHHQYSSRKASHQILTGRRSGATVLIPTGSPWTQTNPSKQGAGPRSAERKTSDKPENDPTATTSQDQHILPQTSAAADNVDPSVNKEEETFADEINSLGDRALARSIMVMHDFMLAREMTLATAAGDSGRVYEIFKMC